MIVRWLAEERCSTSGEKRAIQQWCARLIQCAKQSVSHHTAPPLLTILFISEKRMRELHASYYGARRVTDVLSFRYEESLGEGDEGEIFICLSTAEEQRKRFDVSWKHEVARLIVHGFLHICGYDHVRTLERRNMQNVTEAILATAALKKIL